MHRILHETPPAPSTIAPAVPAALDFVLAKAMAKEPARRYANARDLDVDLEACEAKLVASPAASEADAKGPRAIAVLPFKNIGGNADLNYLGIGLADAVITRLASSPDLIVRATSSIARYENQAVDPLHAAKELGVTTILDASFQRAGERFRATARLVEAPGGQALWAGKVDLKFEDIFDVQDEVALGIANALTARLARIGFTPSPEAYDLLLRSTVAITVGSRKAYEDAMAALERAVVLEPRYADAWAALGAVRHSISDSGVDPDERWLVRAEEAARRALEIDPDHAVAHFTLGALELVRGRKREAYRALAQAYRRRPNEYVVIHYLAYLYRLCNLWDAFYAAENRAIEIDPSLPWSWWAIRRTLSERGRADEGRVWLERIQEKFHDNPRMSSVVASQFVLEGRPREALEFLRGEDNPQSGVFHLGTLAEALIDAGELDEARPLVEQLAEPGRADMDLAMGVAAMHAKLGDADRAFAYLERAVELGNDQLDLYLQPRDFGKLFDDPRWGPFIAGVRERVAAWVRELSWPPA
jgi:TolB-like protein/Tfp pilus assembly protein PilF